MAPEVERRLSAIMFTDIVGYTALMARDEENARRARDRHEGVVRRLVERYQGEWIERTGDETLSTFPSALDAVNCALAVQAELRDDPELRLRIGIHQGDVTFDAGGISGDGVNIAARIRPLAEAGGVCVSDEVQHSLRGRTDLEFASLGARELKNVGRTIAVFAVSGTAAPPRSAGAVAAPRLRASLLHAALVAVALIALGLVGWWWTQGLGELAPIRSIAVLPLENLSGDPEQEYFADGMTEALIGDLAKIGSLRVISRTSVMQYKEVRKPLPEIARELGVDGILEGTVNHEGHRVRVTVQLIDARTDSHVWAERYDRDLGGMLALQSQVAETVAAQVKTELTPDERAGLRGSPVDPRAYDAYVRGLELRAPNTGSIRDAISAFERAVELDPRFAQAYAQLATSRALVAASYLRPPEEREGMMPAALDAARRALELDERQGIAHSTIGLVRLFEWDFAGAGRSMERAVQLSPSDPEVLSAYNWYLLMLVRHEEAREVAERLRLVAPRDAYYLGWVARSFYYTRDYARALQEFERALDLDERVDTYHLFMIYHELGRPEESHRAQVELSRKYAAMGGLGRGRIADAEERGWEKGGTEGEIRAALRVKLEMAEEGFYSPLAIAVNYARLGEADQAFHWLERAYDQRESALYILKAQPFFDSIRPDPRFQDLLRRIGFPES